MTTTYPERPDRAIVNPGHLTTTPTGNTGYVQDDRIDQIEAAMSELATAKIYLREDDERWKRHTQDAITTLETLLDLNQEATK